MDAVQAYGEPESVYRIVVGEILRQNETRRNSHALALADVINLARILTGLPTGVVIYGVELLHLDFGHRLSPVVVRVLPRSLPRW